MRESREQELRLGQASLWWQAQPEVRARRARVCEILTRELTLAGENGEDTADLRPWLTRTFQIWQALDEHQPLSDIDAWPGWLSPPERASQPR